jgi:large subunit ribosomal protein L24
MTVPLSRELRTRFRRRSVPLRKGDTVRILSGSFAGREERVARVNRRSYSVTLDNVTLKTADEKMKALSLGVGHLVITRLNLADPWRRRSMRVRDEDVTPEERGETPSEGEETTEVATPATPTPEGEAKAEPKEETVSGEAPVDGADDVEEPTTKRKAPRRSRAPEPDEEDDA